MHLSCYKAFAKYNKTKVVLLKRILVMINRNVRIMSCVVVMFVLLSYAVYSGIRSLESNWYRSLLPAEVDVGDVVSITGESGFTEGCGAAIFELTPRMRERFSVHGLAAFDISLDQKMHVRGTRDALTWIETPYVETGDGMTTEDTWQFGLICGEPNPDLMRTITNALRQPGSFVKKRHEAAVIVVPASGLVALVYFG